MKIKPLKMVYAVCIAAVISSCSTQNTYITSSWKKPNTSLKKYNNIYIDVLTSNIAAKQQLEDALQQKFTESSIKSKKSIDAMPPDFESQNANNKDAMLSKWETLPQHRGVLVLKLSAMCFRV